MKQARAKIKRRATTKPLRSQDERGVDGNRGGTASAVERRGGRVDGGVVGESFGGAAEGAHAERHDERRERNREVRLLSPHQAAAPTAAAREGGAVVETAAPRDETDETAGKGRQSGRRGR